MLKAPPSDTYPKSLGLLATALSLVLAVIPPEGTQRPWLFELKVVGGCGLILATGLVCYALRSRARGAA